MKNIFLFALLFVFHNLSAQSILNSGGIIVHNATISVGEIIVNPNNSNQSQTGLISMVVEMNNSLLQVTNFEINEKISVYPNPTSAQLYFVSTESLQDEKINIYNNLGQFVTNKTLDDSKSIDLTSLSKGVYILSLDKNSGKSFKIIKN